MDERRDIPPKRVGVVHPQAFCSHFDTLYRAFHEDRSQHTLHHASAVANWSCKAPDALMRMFVLLCIFRERPPHTPLYANYFNSKPPQHNSRQSLSCKHFFFKPCSSLLGVIRKCISARSVRQRLHMLQLGIYNSTVLEASLTTPQYGCCSL
jgi:hypothetical protein